MRSALAVAILWIGPLSMLAAPEAVWAGDGPQPLVQTLPDDGAWGQYHVNFKVAQQEFVLEWFLRSVGREQAGGVDCRWIELEERSQHPERPQQVFKMLVPEGEFGPGKHPLGAVRRVLHRRNPGESVQEVDSIAAVDFGLPIMLAGISGDARREAEPGHVDWARGRLTGVRYAGRTESPLGTARLLVDHRQLRCEEAPFGIGEMTMEFRLEGTDPAVTGKVELVLKDFGTGATSVLP